MIMLNSRSSSPIKPEFSASGRALSRSPDSKFIGSSLQVVRLGVQLRVHSRLYSKPQITATSNIRTVADPGEGVAANTPLYFFGNSAFSLNCRNYLRTSSTFTSAPSPPEGLDPPLKNSYRLCTKFNQGKKKFHFTGQHKLQHRYRVSLLAVDYSFVSITSCSNANSV